MMISFPPPPRKVVVDVPIASVLAFAPVTTGSILTEVGEFFRTR